MKISLKKLGFEPKDYIAEYDHTENDRLESPFDRLSLEELRYLQEHIFFREQ